MISSYSELVVWQRGTDLVEEVYSLTKRLPQEERYALIDQIRRSVYFDSIQYCRRAGEVLRENLSITYP